MAIDSAGTNNDDGGVDTGIGGIDDDASAGAGGGLGIDTGASGPTDPTKFATKRGRGRPPKNGAAGTGGGSDAGSDEGKSSSQKTSQKSARLGVDIDLFARQIVGVHKILAMATKQPILEVDDKEAKSLATAIKNVLVLHSINISPATMAYLQLAGVSASVYGPRVAIMIAAQKMRQQEQNAQNVVDANGNPII